MKNHLKTFLELWDTSAASFPGNDIKFSTIEKKNREKYLNEVIHRLKSYNNTTAEIKGINLRKDFSGEIKGLFKHVFDYSDDQLNIIFSDRMIDATCEFIRAARNFDPELPMESVFQACRNVWIMNSVQILLGKEAAFTPSIFAYSMLYPYTDNFIDDPSVTSAQKIEFSQRFSRRLKNDEVKAETKTEEKIFLLVNMIEKEWERELYPGVYKSLQAIHLAQTKSMALLNPMESLTSGTALEICIDKGGASVVADGFLVAGKLSESQIDFLYSFGAYLQLLDDLQDLSEDAGNGLMTCFFMAAREGNLESNVNKLYWLGNKIIEKMCKCELKPGNAYLKLVDSSFKLFIAGSVLTNYNFISQRYISEIEKHFPLRHDFVVKQSMSAIKQQEVFFKKFSEYAFAGII